MIDFNIKAKITCLKWYQWYLWKRHYFRRKLNKFICKFLNHRWFYYPFKEEIKKSDGTILKGQFYEFVDSKGYRCLGKCDCGAILIDENNYLGIANKDLNNFISIKSG